MPIFSLPSEYGIGDFGSKAYKFVDYLVSAKQSYWQILPLVHAGASDSPYSSVSAESFNPYFISPELLYEAKLIDKEDLDSQKSDGKYIDYAYLSDTRYKLLEKAFNNYNKKNKKFVSAIKSKEFLSYAIFMTVSELEDNKPMYEWDYSLRTREQAKIAEITSKYQDRILFWQFVQFMAKEQWLELKKYANSKGIKIIGDIPFYVSLNSVDVWKSPEIFKLYSDYKPKKVAGVPPDYFSKNGQLWGNPVYDFENQDIFSWWTNRLKNALEMYDLVRIDHFRAFDKYYEIDSDKDTAIDGTWVDVPSRSLFNYIHKSIDKNRVIAEDLGIIDDGVRDLLKFVNYPGMKILSFAFNGDGGNLYLPEHLDNNCVCYTGTHDNNTLYGLVTTSSDWDYNNIINGVTNSLQKLKIRKKIRDNHALCDLIIELGFKSNADLFILPMQDVLHLDSSYRVNEPGTVKPTNWAIKFTDKDFTLKTAKKLMNLAQRYDR